MLSLARLAGLTAFVGLLAVPAAQAQTRYYRYRYELAPRERVIVTRRGPVYYYGNPAYSYRSPAPAGYAWRQGYYVPTRNGYRWVPGAWVPGSYAVTPGPVVRLDPRGEHERREREHQYREYLEHRYRR